MLKNVFLTAILSSLLTSSNPFVSTPIPDQIGILEEPFQYEIPYNTFYDPDHRFLSYNVTLANGSSIPSWLEYDIISQKPLLSLFQPFGYYETPENANRIVIVNHIAYLATDKGLRIINVSNPADPKLLGIYSTHSEAVDVVIIDSIAFLSDTLFGLQIINVSSPIAPCYIGCYKITVDDEINRITVVDHIAYVTSRVKGLIIIDVHNFSNPVIMSFFYTCCSMVSVIVSDDIAYVATRDNGFATINVTNPLEPKLIDKYMIHTKFSGLTINGQIVYVFCDDGFYIYHITTSQLLLKGSYYTPDGIRDVTVFNNVIYIADSASGLLVVDVLNPLNPTLLGRYYVTGFANGVAVANKIAYVAYGYHAGLKIFSLFHLFSPLGLMGSTQTSDSPSGLVVVDQIAYIADMAGGVSIYNVSQPSSIFLLNHIATQSLSFDIVVADQIAYVADYETGMTIYNVSYQYHHPDQYLGSYHTDDFAVSLAVVDQMAYLVILNRGLIIVNVTDPRNPFFIGIYKICEKCFANSITINNHIAYLSAGFSGLYILDVTYPEKIILLSKVQASCYLKGSTVYKESIVYVATDVYGLLIFNVSNPSAPKQIGSYDTSSSVNKVFITDTNTYIACANGLHIIDISNPYNPTLLAVYYTSDKVTRVVAIDKKVYITREFPELQIFGILETPFIKGNISYTSSSFHDITVTASDGIFSLVKDTFRLTLYGIRVNDSYLYNEDVPFTFSDVLVSGISDEFLLYISLNPHVGTLNEVSYGSTSSKYDKSLGIWSVRGDIMDVNIMLSSLTFTPFSDLSFPMTFSLSVYNLSDDFTFINKTIKMICITNPTTLIDFIVEMLPYAAIIIVFCVLSYVCLEYYRKKHNIQHHNSTIVFFVILTVYDFVTDVIFTLSLTNYLIPFIIGCCTIIISFIVNIIILFFFLKKQLILSDFNEWFSHNSTKLAFIVLLASTNLSISKLIVSNLFGLQMFSAPVSVEDKYKLDSYSIITQFTENIPQLVLQLYIAYSVDYVDWPPILVFSLIGSSLMIMFGLINRGLSWIFVYSRKKLKENEIKRQGVQLGEFTEDDKSSFSIFSSSLK